MKKYILPALVLALLLSACGSPAAEVTPTPEPTPTEEAIPSPTPVPTETPVPGALTDEELRWFEEVFFKSGADNIRNVFGCPYNNIYAKPQDINLIELFYDGSHLGDGHSIMATEAEINQLLEQGAFSPDQSESGELSYHCPVSRVTCEEMNEVLLKYTGLTLEETNKVGLDQLPYLEEYDAYYWCHGDVGYPGPLTILNGVQQGSTVYLYQNYGNLSYCLTLEQQPEGNYWFVSNVPVNEGTPTPEPSPDPTPALSYEDYFAQEIDYGSMFDEEEHEYGHFTHIRENDIALAQKLIPDDTIGLIPETMNWVIDGCYSVFWAGNEKGAYLYRLYIPTEILDLIYTIPAEEFKEKYFYTPQTEDVAYFFQFSKYPDGPIGHRICLLREVTPRSNYLYEWSCLNPEFLAKYDEMASHKEDYPQFDWRVSDYDMVSLIESNNWERWEEPFLYIGRCINAATGEYREREIDTHSQDRYEIQW